MSSMNELERQDLKKALQYHKRDMPGKKLWTWHIEQGDKLVRTLANMPYPVDSVFVRVYRHSYRLDPVWTNHLDVTVTLRLTELVLEGKA